MKISINIVIYNGLKYIKPCFDSIFSQSFKDFEIVVVDNNSSDSSVDFIKENYPNVKLILNNENAGFAKAHNQAIRFNNSEYVLVTNQDIILESDFVEKLINFMDENQEHGSCGGKLLKTKYENNTFTKTNIIDCIGLSHTKGYRFFNLGEGSIDNDQFNKDMDIFGVTGALALYRRSALENVKNNDHYFDERFFMYKEDIDLAFRLTNMRFKARYLSNALGYHERSFSGDNDQNLIDKIKRKNSDKEFLAHLSYRNHLLLLSKNIKGLNIHILIEEIEKAFYYLAFKPKIFFKAWKEFFGLTKK